MKKFIWILFLIIFGIGVKAGTIISANDIKFTPADSNWEVNNVNSAINDIYTNYSFVNDTFEGEIILGSYDCCYSVNKINVQGYNYIEFTLMSSYFTSLLSLENGNTKIANPILINTKYDISNYDMVNIVVNKKSVGAVGSIKFILSK